MNQRPRHSLTAFITAGAVLFLVQAQASPASGTDQAFQCTDNHGHVTYQQTTCPPSAAKVLQVDASDHRTEAQHSQAGAALEQQTKLAREMSRHRQQMERQASSDTRKARALTVQVNQKPHSKVENTSSKTTLVPRKRDFRAVYKPPKKARKTS